MNLRGSYQSEGTISVGLIELAIEELVFSIALNMFLEVVTILFANNTHDMLLDLKSLCKLSFSCATLSFLYHKVQSVVVEDPVEVYSAVSASKKQVRLPEELRSITVSCKHDFFWVNAILNWWLSQLVFTPVIEAVTFVCGIVVKKKWKALCHTLRELVRHRGELRVPLHIQVLKFRNYGGPLCRSKNSLPAWVAYMAHEVFHASSQVTMSTANLDIDSDWILRHIGVQRLDGEDVE